MLDELTKQDFDYLIMAAAVSDFRVENSSEFKITKEEMNILKMGHIPEVMEDHWFMYCDDNSINYYRSWTGIQIFKAYYKIVDDEYVIYEIDVNNNKDEYNEENIQKSVELAKKLISNECKY